MTGARLVGIGVGPGDPELLTLAGLRELRTAGRVFVPVLAADERGRAESVVRAHLGEETGRDTDHDTDKDASRDTDKDTNQDTDKDDRQDTDDDIGQATDPVIERLVFALADPVDGAQHRRHRHWDAAARRVADHLLEHGGTAAFATLGDPAVYSTFGYLAATVRDLVPGVTIATVPGITAMQAAASAAGIPLVEGAEPLTVLPLARNVTTLREALGRHGTVVAYKGGRRLRELREVIELAGALDRAVYAEHLGTVDQRLLPLSEVDLEDTVDDPAAGDAPYLSTVVVLPPRGARGEQL